MHVNIEVITTVTCVFAQKAFSISFLDCSLKLVNLVPKFSTDINVSRLCSHGKTNDESSFNKLVRIMAQYLSVFASAWLRLIRVDDQVRRSDRMVKGFG